MEALPNRIAIAFAKYHAITIVMRLYEYIASTYVNEKTLDKLTLDTSDCARRTVREVGPSNGTEIVQSMFTSCLHANFISYLADYSVHQVILLYGYYIYVQKQRSNIRNRRQDSTDGGSTAINDTSNNTGIAIVNGSIVLSFCKKSILLLIQRSFGLVTSSCFGAIGSYVLGVRPGFGTMCGLNLGDTIANTVTESLLSDIPT